MNKFVLIMLVSVCSLFGVEFHSYEEALNLQKKSKKIIMIDIVRDGCYYCEDMEKDVFQNAAMSNWIEKRFISVKMNIDKEKLPLGIKVDFTPMFYFINAENKIVKKIPGAWNIEDFKDLTKGIK